MTDYIDNDEEINFRSTPVVDKGTGTNFDDDNYFPDIEPVTVNLFECEHPVHDALAHFERPISDVGTDHIFITDIDFLEQDSVEYEDTLREYAESLKTGHSRKASIILEMEHDGLVFEHWRSWVNQTLLGCHVVSLSCTHLHYKVLVIQEELIYTGQPHYNAIFGVHGNRPCYK